MLGLFKESLERVFTKDPAVIDIVENVMWLIIIYVFFDAIHGVQGGIIRGIGRQRAGSIFTLVCYYCLPIALTCGFTLEMRLLWLGFTLASVLLGFYSIIRTAPDWEGIAK
jgi:MATE family multidrug resistance protein